MLNNISNNSFGDFMKKFTKVSSALLALFVIFSFSLNEVSAQDFIMSTTGATYNATCGGVIKMKSATGQIQRLNSNPLGTDDANAIKGIVDWAASAEQSVQALYYEKMMLSGGNKTIPGGVNIVGEACSPGELFPGYDDFATYPFVVDDPTGTTNDFTGDFTYSGGPVTVFPLDGDDAYKDLDLTGTGPYTIEDGKTTEVTGTFTAGPSDLTVEGDLVLNNGPTDNSTITGNTTIDNGGSIQVGGGDLTFEGNITVDDGTLKGGDGDIIIDDGSTLTLTGNNGKIDLDGGEELIITGTFTNGGNGTNLDLACTSVVTYNGTAANQIVVPTLASNPYGILNLSAGTKRGGTASYGNNIEICGDFSLAGGNLDMVTNTGYLNMQHVAGNVTYTGDYEVVGKFRRTMDAPVANTAYTFNNVNTKLAYSTVGTGTYYELDVRPVTNPNQYDGTMDVKRKITANYDVSGVTYGLQLGYLASELPSFTGDAAGLTENDFKFFEATAGAIEKVAGTGYAHDQATTFHYVSLAGLQNGNAAVGDGTIENIIASGNDIVLRANNTMYSIVDGRWSNPNVWDEGRIPNENDNVELRTMVYVGIDGPFAGTSGGADNTPTLNTQSEFADYGTGYAANKITIGNVQYASLIIGNEDNGATYVHKAKFNGTSFINNNTNAPAGTFPIIAKGSAVKTGFNGLWLTDYGTNPSMFGAQQIENNGTINNQGIIEVGQ